MPQQKRITVHDRWTIEKAVTMVRKGASIRNAAALYGIAASTLYSKLKRPSKQDHPGKPTILSEQDESRIIDFINRCCKVGLPIDTKRLRISVGQYMMLSGRTNVFPNGIPGRKWTTLFLKRHPEVSRRIPSALSKQRTCVTEESIRKWFDEVSTYICAEKLQNTFRNPASVFNLDETGIRLVPTKESVLAKCGERYVHTSNANSDKESYTVLFCANAAGVLAPPLILFPYKMRLPGEIVRSMPDGWAAGKSDSGWMTQETFYYYLKNVFHPWLVQCKMSLPVIVFVDGHRSHVSYQTTEFCRENGIVLICLYPNSTHVLQPLDVSFFRGLKVRWNRKLIDWRIERAGEPLSRSAFAPLLNQAVDDIDNLASTLQNGFRKCGLVPFDPDAVNYAMLVEKNGSGSESPTSAVPISYTKDEIDRARIAVQVMESFLTSNQRQTFKENEKTVSWVGSTCDINLFQMWKHMKKVANEKPVQADRLETESFLGFEESEMIDHRNHAGTLTRVIQEQSIESVPAHLPSTALVDIISTGNVQPTPASTTSTGSRDQISTDDQNDFFNKAFRIPTKTHVASRRIRRTIRSRPPVVATSNEYKKYYEQLEAEKLTKEKNQAAKRAMRLTKKVEKTTKRLPR